MAYPQSFFDRDQALNGLAPTVLAVGAAGPFAGLVVRALAAQGVSVRGLVRNASEGDAIRAHGAAEIAVGALRDRISLDAAPVGQRARRYPGKSFWRPKFNAVTSPPFQKDTDHA